MEVSDICDFQSRCWSMGILRYLTLEFWYILLPRSLRKGVKLRGLDLDRNRVNFALLEFREILLALSQQVKILRSALILEQSDEIVDINQEQQRTQHGTLGDTMTNLRRTRIREIQKSLSVLHAKLLHLKMWKSFCCSLLNSVVCDFINYSKNYICIWEHLKENIFGVICTSS